MERCSCIEMDYPLKPWLAPAKNNSNLLNKIVKRINYFGDNSNLHGIKNVISAKPIHFFKRCALRRLRINTHFAWNKFLDLFQELVVGFRMPVTSWCALHPPSSVWSVWTRRHLLRTRNYLLAVEHRLSSDNSLRNGRQRQAYRLLRRVRIFRYPNIIIYRSLNGVCIHNTVYLRCLLFRAEALIEAALSSNQTLDWRRSLWVLRRFNLQERCAYQADDVP